MKRVLEGIVMIGDRLGEAPVIAHQRAIDSLP